MAETEAFAKLEEKKASPLRVLMRHPREVMIVIGLTMGGTLAFYTFTTYMQKYLVNTVGFSKDVATEISALALFVYMLLHPLVGALSDRIGRRPLLITFGIFGTLGTYPLLTALGQTRDPVVAFGLIMLGLAVVSCYTAVNAVVKAELFPVQIRALGVGLPYALALSVFGGSAEYVGLSFKDHGHESWFYIYISICIFGSLLVYTFMQDTHRTSRIDRD
jgi:MHS family alpha-ketoglutarate permease-like MFS transporter